MAALPAYHLRWNNHQESLLHVFDKLLQAEDFVDVTLCCQGQNIRAHRMVLSACSPLFHDLLREHPAKHPIVILNDVTFGDMASLMQFMYKGEADVAAECLDSVLHAAHVLGIKGLGNKQPRSPNSDRARFQPRTQPSPTKSYPPVSPKVPLLDQILKDSLAEPSLSLKRCNITPSMRRILSNPAEKSDECNNVYPILQPIEEIKAAKRSRASVESVPESEPDLSCQDSQGELTGDGIDDFEGELEGDLDDNVSAKLEVHIDEDPKEDPLVETEDQDDDGLDEESDTIGYEEDSSGSFIKTEFTDVSFPETKFVLTPPSALTNVISSSGTNTSHPSRLTCELCGKECRSPGEKVIHMRSHTGEKPFVCQECGAGFRRTAHLVRHKLLHTGERPHICPYCDKGFTRKDKLKYHMSFKHGVETPSQSSGGVTSTNSASNSPGRRENELEGNFPDSNESLPTSSNGRPRRGERNLLRVLQVEQTPPVVSNRRKRRSPPSESGISISNCGFSDSAVQVSPRRSVGKAIDA